MASIFAPSGKRGQAEERIYDQVCMTRHFPISQLIRVELNCFVFVLIWRLGLL